VATLLMERALRIVSALVRQSRRYGFREIRYVPHDSNFCVVAEGRSGEPHEVEIRVVVDGGKLRTQITSCPHWEAIAEELLAVDRTELGGDA